MSSHTRQREREAERRLSVRTLLIASAASATAAVVVSQFWIAGTWMAAAVTPVIVTLVSEMLHRPTEVVARRLTAERTRIMPEAAGAGAPPPQEADPLPDRVPEERVEGPPEPPVRVYARDRRVTRRRIAIGVVAVTAALAFAIAALVITSTELVTGGSIGEGNRKTTFFGGGSKQQATAPATGTTTAPQQTQPAQTTPQQTTTTPSKPKKQETTPEQTTTTPSTTTTP